jgi:hypothetical protein
LKSEKEQKKISERKPNPNQFFFFENPNEIAITYV